MITELVGKTLRSLPNFRGKDYLTKRLIKPLIIKRNKEYIVTLNSDSRLICNVKDWIPWNVFVHGKYIIEANYENFMLEKVASCSTVFDVGANIGYYTIQFSSLCSGKVYAFEPMEYQFNMLQRNLQLNGSSNVLAMKQIVSDQSEIKRIYFQSAENTGTSSIHKESAQFEDISSTTLDAFCKLHDIINIDMVKIDVEGHEMAVLQGMENLLEQQRVKQIFVEVCDGNLNIAGSSAKALTDYLESFGYSGHSIKTGKPEEYNSSNGDESLVYFCISK
ncbi:MAG: FkbM family methyltransferase [Balneolales bacterium]|nr:FkbM family methyltransferase [Balneolales bacterium]